MGAASYVEEFCLHRGSSSELSCLSTQACECCPSDYQINTQNINLLRDSWLSFWNSHGVCLRGKKFPVGLLISLGRCIVYSAYQTWGRGCGVYIGKPYLCQCVVTAFFLFLGDSPNCPEIHLFIKGSLSGPLLAFISLALSSGYLWLVTATTTTLKPLTFDEWLFCPSYVLVHLILINPRKEG